MYSLYVNHPDYDAARRDRLDDTFIRLGIPLDIIDMVSVANPAADNPYHGTQHLLTVASRAAAGGVIHGFSDRDVRELTLAGLFHDYGHPLSRDDSVNISLAVEGWYRLGAPYRVDARPEVVERLIWATKFPHSPAEDIRDAIMQDADLMQCLEPDRERFYAGLGQETNAVYDDSSTADFLRSQHINTKWARDLLAVRMEAAR